MTEHHLPQIKLALASQSPARLATLRAAHIEPLVQVSHVDEDAILDRMTGGASQKVLALATAKARAVAVNPGAAANADLILGCDSMFEFGGEVVGKPHNPEVARERLRAMSGKAGVLHTGHCLAIAHSAASLSAVSHATVHIAPMSDAEIDAYIASGEPLEVAGGFTVDGRGGPFIEKVDGDYHSVVGLSLPLLRNMLAVHDISITQLWSDAAPAEGTTSERARAFLSATHTHREPHNGDGFILCSCGKRHWGIAGAGGICAVRQEGGRNQVLLQLRSTWSHGGGTWSIPGGAIEWSESALAGALREFEEETAISADELTIGESHVLDHGDWSYTTFIGQCGAETSVAANGESEVLEWFDIDEPLPQPLHHSFAQAWPHLRQLIERFISHTD